MLKVAFQFQGVSLQTVEMINGVNTYARKWYSFFSLFGLVDSTVYISGDYRIIAHVFN